MDSPLTQHGATAHAALFLRSTARTFTGGAAAMPHQGGVEDAAPTEATPISASIRRQPTSNRLADGAPDTVQQVLTEELTAALMANIRWIVLVSLVFLALLLTMLVLFVWALIAVIQYNDRPCDQPLKYYLVIGILWSQVPGYLTERVGRSYDMLKKFWLTLAFSVPGWFLISWGVFMVNAVETCQKTNPGLYYPTKRYIYGQIVMSGFMLFAAIFCAFGFRRFLLMMNTLIVKPGCEAAVHKLPKVNAGSSELISAEDGEPLSCSICMEAFDGLDGKDVVRTPCAHLFHEECLATWCSNHLDCPFCRQQVGAPDKSQHPAEP